VKATTWEGGIHIPFLVQWKAKLPRGRVYEPPVIQLDIFPTALAAAGVTAPNPKPLDGINLLPYLTGERTGAPHEALYWRFGDQIAIRMGDWKLVKGRGEGQQPLANRRNRGEANTQGALLFNLKDDIGEQHDLAAAQPAKFKELSAAWETWDAELAEPTWGPPVRAAAARRAARAAN
jgi:arylsulfatase A-like enzyme